MQLVINGQEPKGLLRQIAVFVSSLAGDHTFGGDLVIEHSGTAVAELEAKPAAHVHKTATAETVTGAVEAGASNGGVPAATTPAKRTKKSEAAAASAEPAATPAATQPAQVAETPAPAATTPAATTPAAEPAAAAQPAANADIGPQRTDVLAALEALSTKKGLDSGLAALKKFEAKRISEVKPEKYAEFIQHCKEEGAK